MHTLFLSLLTGNLSD